MKLAIWKAASTELCGLHWLIYLIRILASQSKPIRIHFLIYAICLGHKKTFPLIPATLESAFEKSWTFILATKSLGNKIYDCRKYFCCDLRYFGKRKWRQLWKIILFFYFTSTIITFYFLVAECNNMQCSLSMNHLTYNSSYKFECI